MLIISRNPFQPAARECRRIDAPAPIVDLLPDFGAPHIVMLNGAPLLRKDWGTVAHPQDSVAVIQLPQGGGDGKNPLRTVLMVAIAVVASTVVGPAAAGALGLKEGTLAYSLASAGAAAATTVAGAGLVNTFLPPATPTFGGGREFNASPSPTYSITARGNYARLGSAIPVQYGRVRAFPDFAGPPLYEYRHNEQYVTMWFVVGQGFYHIEQVELGNTPLKNYEAASWHKYAPGTPPSDRYPWTFYASKEVGGVLLEGTQVARYASSPRYTDSKYIQLDFAAPNGIYEIGGDGNIAPMNVWVTVRCREMDNNDAFIGNTEGERQYKWTKRTLEPWRFTVTYRLPRRGRFMIFVHRTDGNMEIPKDGDRTLVRDLYWTGMRAIAGPVVAPENATTLCVTLRATDEVAAASSNQIAVTSVRYLQSYENGEWQEGTTTRRAGNALADVLRNADYGIGLATNRIDMESVNDLNVYFFDGRFDSQTTAWEAVTTISRAARAKPFMQGGVFRVARDKDKTIPVAMFSERNIIRGSLTIEYLTPSSETATVVAARYFDAQAGTYRTIASRWDGGDPDEDDAETTIDLFGVTDRDAAYGFAHYLARSNRFRRRVLSFETEMDGFIPSVGDLISISHSRPRWGISGELLEWNDASKTAQLSEPLTWDGDQYIMLRGRDGSTDGPISITRGTVDNEVVLARSPTVAIDAEIGGERENTYFAAGTLDNYSRVALVTNIEPLSEYRCRVLAAIDDDRARTAPPATPQLPSIGDVPDPCDTPTADSIEFAVSGVAGSYIAQWTAVNCVVAADIEIRESGSSGWSSLVVSHEGQVYEWESNAYINPQIRVRVSTDSVIGEWSDPVSLSLGLPGSNTAPLASPTGIAATALDGGLRVTFTPNPSEYRSRTIAYYSTQNDIATASAFASTTSNSAELYGLGAGTTYYVWLRARNVVGILGEASSAISVVPT